MTSARCVGLAAFSAEKLLASLACIAASSLASNTAVVASNGHMAASQRGLTACTHLLMKRLGMPEMLFEMQAQSKMA